MFDDINKIIKPGRNIEDYKRDYEYLMDFFKENPLTSGYFEVHHIVPKCVGGDNSEDNLVRLSARNHILAHILLFRANPDIPGFQIAAGLMVNVTKINTLGGKRLVSKEKLDTINSIDLDILSEIREISRKSSRKAVVCFRNNVIYKIYESISFTREDGFNPDSISHISDRYLEDGKCYCRGYCWAKLDEFILNEENRRLVEEYYNSSENIINPIPLTDKESQEQRTESLKHRVIVCTKQGEIDHIYQSIKDTILGDFSRSTVCDRIDTGIEYYERLWYTEEGYSKSFPDIAIDYSKSNSEFNSSSIFLKEPAIVAYKGDIYKLYRRISDAEDDGFDSSAIVYSINNNGTSGGYCWMRYLDFIKKFPEICPSESVKISAQKVNIKIVAADLKNNYIKTYSSIRSTEIDKIFPESVRQSIIRGEGSIYRGIRWYTEDYYLSHYSMSNEKNINDYLINLPKTNRKRKPIVSCDSKMNIIKIYESISSISEDGYKSGNIRKVLTRKTNRSSGLLWYYLEEFERLFPDKIKEYYEKGNTNINNT